MAGYPPIASRFCKLRCSQFGADWYDPLARLAPLLLAADFATLNRPKEKILAVRAFPGLGTTPVVTGGVQVQAGVREFMRHAVAGPGYNSAVAYYNELAAAHGVAIRGDADGKAGSAGKPGTRGPSSRSWPPRARAGRGWRHDRLRLCKDGVLADHKSPLEQSVISKPCPGRQMAVRFPGN